MKKIANILLIGSIFVISSCGKTNNTPIYEKGTKKDVNGAGLIFQESLGFNTKDATIFEEDNERYIVYDAQEEAKGQQVFAARKATLVDGTWKYGEKHIVLRPSSEEDAWDSHISNPSVVKGNFAYRGANYSYLMAYQGNTLDEDLNNSIGLAVTNNVLGEWTKVGNSPILENPEIYESSFGFGSPELISVDQNGLLLLAYSFGETLLSGERVKILDASTLDNINLELGYAELPCEGLLGRDDSILANCGLAIGKESKSVYLANDGMPSSNKPGCSSSFEIACADLDILSSAEATWTSIQKVSGSSTVDESNPDSMGWDEIYSASFVRDAYGYIDEDKSLELVYSTYNEVLEDAKWTAQLCSYEVK